MDDNSRERLTLKVVKAQAGDRDALGWVLAHMQDELFGYLLRYTGRRDIAEDALQDTFLILCRQLKWLRQPQFFRTWVYRIATREAWRRMRVLREHEPLPLPDVHPEAHAPQVEDLPPDSEQRAKILDRIASLPPNCRAVVLLHYWSGLSLASAAAALDIPIGTVKSRLAYALELLRKDSPSEP